MKDLLLFHYWCFRTFSLRRNFPKLKIKSIFQTIDDIIINKKSISRFGDGELRMMIGNGKIVFQNENNDLSNKLNEVLTSNLKNHIVALPEAFVFPGSRSIGNSGCHSGLCRMAGRFHD